MLPSIYKKSSQAFREDFLVRNIGKRAIHVILPYHDKNKHLTKILTNNELQLLIIELVKYVNKNYNWKHFSIKIEYDFFNIIETDLFISNPAGYKVNIGKFKDLINI